MVHERSTQSANRSGGIKVLDSHQPSRKNSSEPDGPILEHEEPKKVNATKHIMIVDDEPDVLLTYKSFLTSAGHIVEPFSDVQEAIIQFIIKQSSLDLVILDIRMPDVNGLQLFQKFKAINPQAKIMFVTSLDAAKELVSIFPDIDPDHVLKKPVKKIDFYKL